MQQLKILKDTKIYFSRIRVLTSDVNIRFYFVSFLAFFQLIALLDTYIYFENYGYLPTPYISDKNDTFMDLFHTLYWANDDGKYTDWRSVYPPLVFLLIKPLYYFVPDSALFNNAFQLRDNGNIISVIYVFAAIFCLLVSFYGFLSKNMSVYEKFCLTFFFVFSPVTLFAIERGNLIVFAPVLLFIMLLSKESMRPIFLALLINFKPYFVILSFVFLFRREYLLFFKTTLLSLFVFLITGMLLDFNFPIFLENLFAFNSNKFLFSPESIQSMSSSITIYSYLENWNQVFSDDPLFNEQRSKIVAFFVQAVNYSTIFAIFVLAFLKGKRISFEKGISILIIVITNFSFSFGGYSLIFYLPILQIFMTFRLGIVLSLTIITLFFPLDLIVINTRFYQVMWLYLSNSAGYVTLENGLGSLVRPGLNFFMMLVMIAEFYKNKLLLNNEFRPLKMS